MSQHYTRSTSAVLAYCPTCNRKTMHRVDDRRMGPCLEHRADGRSKKKIREDEKREEEMKQGNLF
jgi:ribosomal protein L44E